MMKRFVLAFDVGTTTLKAGLVDLNDFLVVSKSSMPSKIEYPNLGWAEEDPEVLWSQIVSLSNALMSEKGVDASSIAGVIFTAHMAGILPVDKEGNPLRNIIIWLDERAAGLPRKVWQGPIKIAGYNAFKLWKFIRLTGGAPSKTGKDPISKIIWLKENEPDIYNKSSKIVDVKGFLILKATGNYVTSHDEAHLTWLAYTKESVAKWSETLLKDYGLSMDLFPKIKDSVDVVGRVGDKVARALGVKAGTPVILGAGDLTTSAVGSGAIEEGYPHIYIGTSDWIAAHISKMKVDLFHYIGSLLSAIPRRYLLIAEQEVAAGALEWAMSLLGFGDKDYQRVERAANLSPPGSNNLLFLPWFYGERSPIDDPFIRGGLVNLSFQHRDSDIIRAIMEGVAFNIRWAYKYFRKIIGYDGIINIVGGGALFDTWCQIVADVLKVKIRRISSPQDAGLRGAATIAGVGLGIYNTFEEAVSRYGVDRTFVPIEESSRVYDKLYRTFVDYYKRNKKIYRALNLG
jgi:xylulokinase